MLEIEKPDVMFVEGNEDKTYGKFVVQPLMRGRKHRRRRKSVLSAVKKCPSMS